MIPSKQYTSRLNKNDYKRPKKTMTEEYQNEELIKEKLKNYIEVPPEEFDFINIGSHLRYISYDPKTKKELFRFGGILVTRKKDYIILAGKEQKTFSVQRYIKDNKGNVIYNTRFFRLLKKEELLQEALDNTVDKSKEFLTKQNDIIQKQQKEIEELRSMMKKLGKK